MNDRVDPLIRFDKDGLCNHCVRYDNLIAARVFKGEAGEKRLHDLIETIKAKGSGRSYDCVIGVSGGVDSSYVAYLTKRLGLRPLAVHFDNGWNSELAVSNIERVLKALDIDFITHVADWEEFRDLQLAFLFASTPDGEVPTDHAINALLWRTASQYGIKYIISGMNFATEALSVPHWSYGHIDWRYIKDVHRRFGTHTLKNYPHMSLYYLAYVNLFLRVRSVSILNYVDYNKENAMDLLRSEFGWVDYGGKHYESIYTRFFQGYILPQKFNIDKRYGHLSDLINSGQMSKSEALAKLKDPIYPTELLEQDREFVIKKLQLTSRSFKRIMHDRPRSFMEYRNNFRAVNLIKGALNFLRSINLYPK